MGNERVKVRVRFSDGRKEKIAIPIANGECVPLNQAILGADTGWKLEWSALGLLLKKDASVSATAEFRCNGRSGEEFAIHEGDLCKSESLVVEFLELPVMTKEIEEQPEAATRVISRPAQYQPKAQVAASSQAPVTNQLSGDAATSIIQKMKVPEKPVTAQRTQSQLIMDFRSAPEETTASRLRAAKFWHIATSWALAASCSEVFALIAKAIFRTSLENWRFGYATLISGGLIFVLGGAANALANWKTEWRAGWLTQVRRGAWTTMAVLPAFLIGMGWVKNHRMQLEHQAEVAQAQATTPAPGLPEGFTHGGLAEAPVAAQPIAAPPVATAPVAAPAPAPAVAEMQAPKKDYDPDQLAKEAYFSAVKSGDLGLVAKLVDQRAVDVNFTLDRGASGMHVAAASGQLPMIKYLLSKKANINAKDPSGTTPLMWAVFRKHKNVVEYLVRRKADLAARREDGDRAVDLAKRYGFKSVASMLQPKDASRSIASERSKSGHKKSSQTKSSKSKKKSTKQRHPASVSRSYELPRETRAEYLRRMASSKNHQ